MACKGGPKSRALSFVSLLITPFAILITSATAVDRLDRGQHSTKPSVASAPFFLPPAIYDPKGFGAAHVSVAVADVNGDGKFDLLVANRFACPECANGSVAVFLGNGDGRFRPVVTYDSGAAGAEKVVVADLNGDTKPDVVVGNDCGGCSSGGVAVLLGNGNGTFQPAVTYETGFGGTNSLTVADVTGDGKLDVVCLTLADGAIAVLTGFGDGTFLPGIGHYDPGGQQPQSIAAADVNGDGKRDLVVANRCPSQGCTEGLHNGVVGVLLQNGVGTFQPVVTYFGGNHTSDAAIADVNGDGKPDLLEVDFGDGAGVLLGNGDGSFRQRVGYDTGGYTCCFLAVADVNGDGKRDLVVGNAVSGTIAVLPGKGDGTFQPAVIQAKSDPRSLSMADLNGDGGVDLVVGTSDGILTPLVGVMLNNSADATRPIIALPAFPRILWPPSGKLVPVIVFGTITDIGSGVNLKTASYAVKDEYDEVQPTGRISLDNAGNYRFTILLQASRRLGDLNGRQYMVTVRAKDNAGNAASKTGYVIVPQGTKH